MTPFRKLSLLALPLILATVVPAHAGSLTTTIDFNGLSGPSGISFYSYAENGYTASTYSGDVYVNAANGDPAASIYTLDTATIDVQETTGGADFLFDDVDFAKDGSTGTYSIVGYLDGVQVFIDSGSISGTGTYTSYGTGSDLSEIDDLRMTFTSRLWADNITLTTVSQTPELTGGFLLLGTGLIGAFGVGRRRFSR